MSSLSGDHQTKARLLEQNEELRRRLEEAEQALEAIRSGNVDALVVADAHGEQIYTLTGAEHVYRVIVETMNEAAVTVDTDGTVLFCNQRFCDLMKTPMQETLGRRIASFVARPQRRPLERLMADAQAGPVQRRITLRAVDGTVVPVQLSASLLHANGATSVCLVASDLTELEASANSIRVLREHQQALEESESRFRTIFEASQDAIVITDDEGTYIQANPAVETIMALSSEQLIGRRIWDFVSDAVEFSAIWRDFLATGSFRGEMPITGADGQVRYVDAYAVANILPGRHLCVIRDVTERKRAQEALEELNAQLQVQTEELQAQTEELNTQAEELRIANEELRQTEQALRESRRRLENIVDSIADGFYALDRHWRFTHINDAALAYFGRTREEVLGHTLVEIFPGVRGTVFETEYQRAMETGEPVHIETPSAITDRMVEIHAYPGPENLTVLFRDATERLRMQQALRESEERFHRLFEDDLTGNFISTPEGQILLCNPAFARIFGFSSVIEAVGTSLLDLYIDAADREQIAERLKREGRIERLEVWRKRRDGEPIYIVENVVGHFDDRGELYEIKGYIFDDTERKRAEESLLDLTRTLEARVGERTAELEFRARQLQKLALELSQAEEQERRRLAEILHDDLQQQLAAAKFHVGILASRARGDLSVQKSALQIDKMLRDAVETSRSLSHELSPAVMYHGDLGEILEWLANQIRAKHGLIVHVDAYGEINTQSDALKTFLFKAVQEMLFNAVKHARVGEARVRVRRMGRYICLSVSDRGRGFDPQELKQTVGFGLMSIRERIGLLGGRMRIHSVRGEGSRFIITVPDGELATDSELALAARPVAKGG